MKSPAPRVYDRGAPHKHLLNVTKSLTHHRIYDAALDETLFDTLPECLARDMGVPSAVFFWIHPGDTREITAGTQPEANADYLEVADLDPWMAEAKDERANKGAFRLSRFVGPAELEQSVMYNEVTLKYGLDRYWCLGMLQDTRDGRVITAFHKGKMAGDFTDSELDFVNRYARDLAQLHSIRRELVRNEIRDIAATDRSLQGEVPIYELDHEGKLLRMNGMAEALLLLHPFLILQRNRVMALGGPGNRVFSSAVGYATKAGQAQASWARPAADAGAGRAHPAKAEAELPSPERRGTARAGHRDHGGPSKAEGRL